MSGHIGSIELFAAAGALRGLPTYGLADDTEYPELFARLTDIRAKRGVRIIPWKNLRDVFRALREPAVLGLVVDWGYRPSDVPVTLFGEWTTLPAGPATLAAKTGALIVPVVNRRQADGTYLASHMRSDHGRRQLAAGDPARNPADRRRTRADGPRRARTVVHLQTHVAEHAEEAAELERRAAEMDAG